MNEEHLTMPHKLTLDNREKLTMTGVTEVLSFDETAVILRTELGALHVQGDGLKLKTLSPDGGQVTVTGTVTALVYEQIQRGGVLRRLFG